MNATTKKTGSGKRAAFAIEEAIADTRKRIAASAGANLRQKAQAALAGSPRLTTEADGRKFAISMLEKFEKLDPGARFSSWSANAEAHDGAESGVMMIFRQSAQTDIAKRACDAIYQATEEARNGFFVVLTDFIGGELEQGGKNSERYREMEKAGELQPWGSMIFKNPAKVVDAIAAGETCYRIGKAPAKSKAQKQAEEKAKGPLLEAGQAEAVEQFIGTSGPWRRAAMAFLEKPYAEMAGYIKTEKKTAEAFAEIAAELAKWKENYMTIILRLTHAERDMRRAIAERKDGAAILQRAKQLVKTEKAFR